MERRFFVKFGNENQILDQMGVQNLFKVALLRNKDIRSLFVLEVDNRLNEVEGRIIANGFGLTAEYNQCIENGDSPLDALKEWDIC
jgi:hypothetical protein